MMMFHHTVGSPGRSRPTLKIRTRYSCSGRETENKPHFQYLLSHQDKNLLVNSLVA